ncbi:MAG: AmmeMemoRadiSam system radical SAM enzyme [Ignavibacteriales bacterium]
MTSPKEAAFFERTGDGAGVRCLLCPRECVIAEGKAGFCRVRKNVGGTLRATGYAKCSSYAVDPIEKKPLYHFYPGSYILSVGTTGCNLGCRFCQNWQIAHEDAPTQDLPAESLVKAAVEEREVERRVVGIAYTYSEPVVWYEYVIETAALAREEGLKNVLVTNGFIRKEPLKGLLPLIDGVNVDVKAFNDEYYRRVCAGTLEPVLRTVEAACGADLHVEVTTLVVPGLNDSDDEIRSLSRWLASVGKGIPLHFSRYFPNYRMTLPPTPESTLRRCRETAMEYLHYVFTGNVADTEGQNTYCPQCGATLLERSGLALRRSRLENGRCPDCGRSIEVRGEVFV